MAVLQVCLLSLFVVCTTSSYMFSNTIIINNGAYNVSYNFNESADTLEFLVEASATGWVGFGFSLNAGPNDMVGYDVAVGGVLSNGTGYLRDYFTSRTGRPPKDSQQDWVLINSNEQSGITTLKFYRKRNTSDSKDIAIEQGVQVYIVWAYHSTDDVDPDSGVFDVHDGRGVEGPITLIPTITSTMAEIPTTTIASMTTSEMPAMVTTTEAEVSTPALPAMTTSTMAAMTTSAVIEVGPSTMVEMTTSAMEEMTTSVLAEVGTSTMVEIPTTTMASMTTSEMPAMVTTTEAEVSTPALPAMTTSTMATMTTSAVIEMGPSTMVEKTTSTMEGMITSILAEIDTSTMAEMTTSTMGAMTASPLATSNTPAMIIEPTTATTAVATSSPVATASPGQPQHFANFRSLDNGNYNVSWMFNSSMDSLHFTVEVRATGWVGFGVATQAPNNMTYYDVAVGGVVSGSGLYLTRGFGPPPEDTKQDWVLTYSREDNGITTLQFYRKLNTSDANDTVIQQEVPIFLIWAYHTTSDVQKGRFMKHSYSGFMQIILIAAPTTPGTPTNPPAQTTPSTPTNPPAQPTPTMFPLSFDNNRFLVFWRFDDQNDNIFIHLRVKTTGWIGFGFAETAPSNMMNYDVIVGGYSNGQGYLNDSFTSGQGQPPPDASQDYQLLNASEVGGYTELMFERRRDTGDNDNDLTFMPGGQFYFVWAYHTGDVTDISNFQKHSRSGVSPEKYTVVPAQQPIPTEAAAPSLQYSSICGLFSLLVATINVFSLSS